MKIKFLNRFKFNFKIKNFEIDPISERIIATGEKLYHIENGNVVESIAGKLKNSEIIKFIINSNQFFSSNCFFVSTRTGSVYKCHTSKKKVIEEVFNLNKVIEYINFTRNGTIIYVENSDLYGYDPEKKKLELIESLDENISSYKIIIDQNIIITKYREIFSQNNKITLYNENFENLYSFETDKNHIFSKVIDLFYYGGTNDGEVEIWDILKKELYNSIKLSESKIIFFNKYEDNFFIFTENGNLIITDLNFVKLSEEKEIEKNIIKAILFNKKIYLLNSNNSMSVYEIEK